MWPHAAIDIHTHVVPEQFPKYLGSRADVPWPSMAPAHACHAHVMINGKVYRTVHQACWHTADRAQYMSEKSITTQCLSPMPELLSYWLPLDDGKVLIRYINDQIAGMVARDRKRFIGLGGVPLQDVDAAIRELEYVVNDLGFAGVEIASHVNNVPIGDARFDPFFSAVEKLDCAVFVHALRPAGQDRIVGPVSEQAMCFPNEIALAAGGMITGGMAERHPHLRIAFSHGGGAMTNLVPRLNQAWKLTPKFKEALPRAPGDYARRFYYDTVVFDPTLLAHIVGSFGKTQICIGSDYPFAMGDLDPITTLGQTRLDDETLALLSHGNARRFLGRRAPG
jgi:aminocarboxymuconate-semialdehyde decarboxylase